MARSEKAVYTCDMCGDAKAVGVAETIPIKDWSTIIVLPFVGRSAKRLSLDLCQKCTNQVLGLMNSDISHAC